MASFPSAIFSQTNPSSTSPRNNPSLAGEITGLNNEVTAIETTLGINLANVPGFVNYSNQTGSVATKTGSYTMRTNDYVVLMNSAGAASVTLPSPTAHVYFVKNINVGTCTLQTLTTATIDGHANVSLGASVGAQITSDGANWYVVGQVTAGTIL